MHVKADIETEFEYLREKVYSSLCKALELVEGAAQDARMLLMKASSEKSEASIMLGVNLLEATAETTANILKMLTLFIENTVYPEKSQNPCWS